MMKRIIGIILILSIFLVPLTSVKAETLKDYKNVLNKYISDQKANQNKINQTDNQINASKNEVASIQKEIQNMHEEITKMQQEIVDFNVEIKEKQNQSKEVIKYYQTSRSDNLYLEYAFGAETIADLVYRLSVVEQLVSHNEKTIKNLNEMIEANKKREIELNEREIEINKREEELNKKITNLTGEMVALNDTSVTVSQQIKVYKDLVSAYEKMGCKDNDVIGQDCAVNNSVAGWFRPVTSGYVTSEFGWRWGSLHRALDITNSNHYYTKIYPVANGTIIAKYYDSAGALVLVISHNYNGKSYSSLYAHMRAYAPNLYVGKKLTTNDYIGYMGSTGIGTGPHLHLEIAPCRIMDPTDKTCGKWNNYVSYMQNLYNKGYKGPRELIYFPNPYVFFSGR